MAMEGVLKYILAPFDCNIAPSFFPHLVYVGCLVQNVYIVEGKRVGLIDVFGAICEYAYHAYATNMTSV